MSETPPIALRSGKRTSEVARTAKEVAELESAWREIGVGYVDAEFDHFETIVRSRPEIQPYVVCLFASGRPAGLVVGHVERARLICRIGYLTVYRPKLLTLRVAHGGVSGAHIDDVAAALVYKLEDALRQRHADVLIIPAVRIGSPLDEALSALPRHRRQPGATSAHRRLLLPSTYDELLAARPRRSRYNLNRQSAMFEREFEGRFAVDLLSEPHDFNRIFHDLELVARSTYQRGLGAGFADTPVRRELVRLALERKWFRAWVLSIEGRPVAFWQGTVRDGTYYSSSTGYDPAYMRQGVGTYLQLRMFRDLCDDAAVQVVDFGWGDAEYKARFGNESWEEHDVLVFAPTLRGLRAGLIRKGIGRLDHHARGLVDRVGATSRVKRHWRHRLRADTG